MSRPIVIKITCMIYDVTNSNFYSPLEGIVILYTGDQEDGEEEKEEREKVLANSSALRCREMS